MWIYTKKMGINKVESQFLFKEKILEGKSEDIVNFEIKRDKVYIKDTRKKIRLESINKKHEINKDLAFKKAFERLSGKRKSQKIEDKFNRNLILYKRRIMMSLTESPKNRSELRFSCCMLNEKINEIIFLLLEEGKIEEKQVNGRETIYGIK